MPIESAFEQFAMQRRENILSMMQDVELRKKALEFNAHSARYRYTYNFTALGRPIIQLPQDIVAIQELVWTVRPELIIETGIAHGGSLILSASMLALLDYCDAVDAGTAIDPSKKARRRVLGIDIDIRPHNLAAIKGHPMAHRIDMIQGSSIEADVIAEVRSRAEGYEQVMVMLDSNHTHAHVLAELQAYAPLVSRGSYCVVFDTVIEDLPKGMFPDRPWDVGDNPKTAVRAFLEENPDFFVDEELEAKLLITVAPNGYLRRR